MVLPMMVLFATAWCGVATLTLTSTLVLSAAAAVEPQQQPPPPQQQPQQQQQLPFCVPTGSAWYMKTGGDPSAKAGWKGPPTDRCCRANDATGDNCIWFGSETACTAALAGWRTRCLACEAHNTSFGCPTFVPDGKGPGPVPPPPPPPPPGPAGPCVPGSATCLPTWNHTWHLRNSTLLYTCNNSGLHDISVAKQWGVVVYDWSNAKEVTAPLCNKTFVENFPTLN
jgi:hypothetical protein